MIYNHSYFWLLQLKQWHRYVVTMLIITVWMLLWSLFFYLPLYRDSNLYTLQLAQRQQDQHLLVSEQTTCKRITQEIEQLRTAVSEVAIDIDTAVQQMISLLLKELEKNSLLLISLHQDLKKSVAFYSTVRLTMQLKGSLASMHSFLHALLQQKLLLQCPDFTLEYQQNGTYQLQLALHYFVPKKIEKIPSTLEKAEGLGGKQHCI